MKPDAGAAGGPSERSAWLPVALVLVVGVSLSVAMFLLLRDRQHALQRAILSERVTAVGSRLGEAFALPIETARSAAGLFAASERVTRDEFGRFVADARARAPQVHAFEWAPRVSSADRGGFEAAARTEVADFTVREIGPDGALVPARERPMYAPLLYQEPSGRALGYDVASDPETRAALDRACTDAIAVTSGRRRLRHEDGAIVAAITYVPAWRRGVVPPPGPERCRTVLGYVTLVFDVARAVDGVMLAARTDDLELVVRDLAGGPGADVMFATAPTSVARVAASSWRARRTFHFVDRTWAIDVAPARPAFAWMPTVVLVLGIVASVLGAALAGGVRQILELRRQVVEARSFGQYFLEEEIGRGGMGIVYRARHALMQRATAIKLVSPDSAQPNLLAQFEREVQITSQLSHPNTIAIYDYGHTREGEFYYVMELVDGINFEQLVAHDGAQPVSRTIHLISQVCAALREAHALGVVHRDLKPANLMITARGGVSDFVKVLDFGLVKKIDPADPRRAVDAGGSSGSVPAASRLASTVRTAVDRPRPPLRDDTLEGQFLGTAGYASPEVIVGGTTDARSDLYAVGAVWFALLTGKPAFDDTLTTAIFAAQLRDHPPRPSSLVAGIPPVIDDLVARCLHRDPGKRPQSADELLEALAAPDLPVWTAADADAWWRDRAEAVRAAARGPSSLGGRPTVERARAEVARHSRTLDTRTLDTRTMDTRPGDARRLDTRRIV